MEKVMRIFGNFKFRGEWSKPDPGFDGHIVVQDDGKFMGYHRELYGDVKGMESIHTELNKLRLVVGYIAPNNKDGAEGIAFMKLSREDNQSPFMYVVPDLAEIGEWAAPGLAGFFERKGAAKVSLEDVTDTDTTEIKDTIARLHEALLEADDEINISLLNQVDTCLELLQHVT